MDSKTANKLDRLLADGDLRGPEADAIFDRVYAQVARTDRVQRPVRRVFVLTGCVAAAAVALFVWRATFEPHEEFAARGDAAALPVLDASCSVGTVDACPVSAKLVFIVSGDSTTGFLSAYAEPLDPAVGADRVWYFSRESESPRIADTSDGTHVFERAVRLMGTHREGRYRVHAFFADHPLGRDDMLAGSSASGIRARRQFDLVIVEK
jgi:hypothetical protein